MAINASAAGGGDYDIIPPDNYVAVCYEMIHIGTVPEDYMGKPKNVNKVRISWETSNFKKVWKEGEPERPYVISKEYTLHLGDTANLRKALVSWRGKDFTPTELENFDIEKLVGAPCMLNVIEKTSKAGKVYNDIGSISRLPKEIPVPAMVNPKRILNYTDFDLQLFESLPDFIKTKIKTSKEYRFGILGEKEQEDDKNKINMPPAEDDDASLPF